MTGLARLVLLGVFNRKHMSQRVQSSQRDWVENHNYGSIRSGLLGLHEVLGTDPNTHRTSKRIRWEEAVVQAAVNEWPWRRWESLERTSSGKDLFETPETSAMV